MMTTSTRSDRLILTVINDSDAFWYEQLIPFLLSLKQTDYQGDIGIVSYDLSAEKQAILQQNGCLVFPAPQHYSTLLLDRQWAAAEIAQDYGYDYVALYDADIWFPSPHLTLFDEVKQREQLYCSYDPIYGEFLVSCVRAYGQDKVRSMIDGLMQKQGYPWQAGVIVGHRQAWGAYQHYLTQLLKNPADFAMEFGIDATAIQLYSIEQDGIAHLPERYNCLPSAELLISNLASDGSGKRLERECFTLHGQAIQGLHVVGTFRMWGRHRYEYVNWHHQHYHEVGKAFRPKAQPYQTLPCDGVIEQCQHYPYQQAQLLGLKQIQAEGDVQFRFEQEDILFISAGGFKLTVVNPTTQEIQFDIAIQSVLGQPLSKGRYLALKNYKRDLVQPDIWYGITLPAGAEMVIHSYDLDVQRSRLIWRFKQIKFVSV